MVLLLLITVCERAAAKESAPLESVHRDPRVSPAVLLHGKGQGTWLGLGPIVHHPGAVSPRISDAMLMNLYFSGGVPVLQPALSELAGHPRARSRPKCWHLVAEYAPEAWPRQEGSGADFATRLKASPLGCLEVRQGV